MKILIFDYLRAFSVFLITYYHIIAFGSDTVPFLGPLGKHITLINLNTRFDLLLGKYVNLGEIGVSLFFLLSGFLIMKSLENKKGWVFLIGRFQRIYPVAIIGVILNFLIVYLVNVILFDSSIKISSKTIISLICNCFLINDFFPIQLNGEIFNTSYIMPTYWFLLVILKFYLLMSLCKNNRNNFIYISSFILLYLLVLYPLIYNCLPPIISLIYNVFSFWAIHCLYILIGSSLYIVYGKNIFGKSTEKVLNKNLLLLFYVISCYILAFFVMKNIENFPIPIDMLKNYGISLTIFIFCIFINKYIAYMPTVIKLISESSFSTYVIHFHVGAVFVYFFSKFEVMANNLFLLYLSVFFMVFLCGFILFKLIEQPMNKFRMKVSRPR